MKATWCPHCDARLSAAEVGSGWCDGCGKKLPASLACRAKPSEHGLEAPTGEPRAAESEKLTAGQMVLMGLFGVAVCVLIGSALMGDAKSIGAFVKIGAMVVAAALLAGLRGLWGMIRGQG